MRKRILPILCLLVLCLTVVCPFGAQAVTPLDPEASASLTLYYQKEDKAFPDLEIWIYRVAEAFPNGSFELIEPYASYPVNIHDVTKKEQWKTVAATLNSYIVANQVEPYRTAMTNASGIASFENLETGLYLISEVIANDHDGTYIFDRFMVYLPTQQEDGVYDYTVEAKPKCTEFIPKTHYTVTKLWQDAGNESNRPSQVTVEIYKDGVLQETQVLSTENNWSYTWSVSSDDPGKWTVTEQAVPESYKVSIQQNGCNFTVINTSNTTSDIPETGDSFAPLPWILAMCFSGIMLLILGLYSRRRKA